MATPPDPVPLLHVGMRDAHGGTRPIDDPQPSIRGLQDALRAVGVIPVNEHPAPGSYDKLTTAAVRRFRWYQGNIPGYFRADTGYGTRTSPVLRYLEGAQALPESVVARTVQLRPGACHKPERQG